MRVEFIFSIDYLRPSFSGPDLFFWGGFYFREFIWGLNRRLRNNQHGETRIVDTNESERHFSEKNKKEDIMKW